MGVSKKLLTPSVIGAVVEKVSQKRITNSKDLRKLRTILPDPVARENFLSEQGDLETASLRISPGRKEKGGGLSTELDAAVEAMKRVPWTALVELKGDPEILKKIDDVQALLKSLRKTLSS
jgi:ParB family chromosome partitioning protein